MDYSHNPYLFYAIGAIGALIGVVFVALALLFFRTPPSAREGHDAAPPKRHQGDGPA